jgi:hypothetical protein
MILLQARFTVRTNHTTDVVPSNEGLLPVFARFFFGLLLDPEDNVPPKRRPLSELHDSTTRTPVKFVESLSNSNILLPSVE